MRGPARIANTIAVSMAVAGFLLIFFAWNGAAEYDTIQQQFPFALSGGLGGLGLIIVAMVILGVQMQRRLTAERARDMRELQQTLSRLLAVASTNGASAPGAPAHPAPQRLPAAPVPAGAGRTTPAPDPRDPGGQRGQGRAGPDRPGPRWIP